MNISTEKKIMDFENRLVAAWWEREGEGVIWNLGLSDTTWNGFTWRSCWVASRTMSRYLYCNRTKGGKKCIHVRITWSPCCTVGKKKLVELQEEIDSFTNLLRSFNIPLCFVGIFKNYFMDKREMKLSFRNYLYVYINKIWCLYYEKKKKSGIYTQWNTTRP